jgi:hypothetical protein
MNKCVNLGFLDLKDAIELAIHLQNRTTAKVPTQPDKAEQRCLLPFLAQLEIAIGNLDPEASNMLADRWVGLSK